MKKSYYVIRRRKDGYYHCRNSVFRKQLNRAIFYSSIKTAIRYYYDIDGEYKNLEVVEIKIEECEEIEITDDLYKKYNNGNYKDYLEKEVKNNEI